LNPDDIIGKVTVGAPLLVVLSNLTCVFAVGAQTTISLYNLVTGPPKVDVLLLLEKKHRGRIQFMCTVQQTGTVTPQFRQMTYAEGFQVIRHFFLMCL
jgi:hypothetical protein